MAGWRRVLGRLVAIGCLAALVMGPVCSDDIPPGFVVGECSEGTDRCCGDGQDNDNDTHVDCADKDCLNVGPCRNVEDACDDGLDNDKDNRADCLDPDCFTACGIGPGICANGLDDDEDGDIDCADTGGGNESCAGTAWCLIEPACGDTVDDDNDGAADCDDPGCAQSTACFGEVACNDTLDNDGNAAPDNDDSNCAWTFAVTCPPGQLLYNFKDMISSPIPDLGTLTKTFKIPMTGRLHNFVLRMDLYNPSQIDIRITAPDGVPRDVSVNNVSGGYFPDTELRDDATMPISSASHPFYQNYNPNVPFSTYVYGSGRRLDGDWVLTFTDVGAGVTGNVYEIDLAFCVDP